MEQFRYEVFLQGSYKNDTNLGGDSDFDVVIRLAHKLDPNVVVLTGAGLQKDDSHKVAHRQRQLFRRIALRAVRARFGDHASSGRKTLKIKKGTLPADGLAGKVSTGAWVSTLPEKQTARRLTSSTASAHHIRSCEPRYTSYVFACWWYERGGQCQKM